MVDRAAITGIGLITPAGRGVDDSWRAVAEGRSALTEAPGIGLPAWARWTGMVSDLEPPSGVPGHLRSQLRFLNRGALLALTAAGDAINQAAPPSDIPPDRRSLFLATGDLTTADCLGLSAATRAAAGRSGRTIDSQTLNRVAVDRVNPFFLLTTLANNPFSTVTAAFGLEGPGTTLASHSPSGGQVLDLACRSIARGRSELAVAVASTSWLDLVPRLEMAGIGLLSRCTRGARSFRPLDRRRDGFVVGEGGAAVVLERPESARRRGAPILGMIEATSGCHETSSRLVPNDRTTLRCMRLALTDASLAAGDIGFITVHGSGTRKGDRAELRSVAALRHENGAGAPVCALKPYTGHMGAASDLFEVVIGLEAARRGVVPATLNFDAADEEFADLPISGAPQPCANPCVLSVSYGFGGQSSAVVARASLR